MFGTSVSRATPGAIALQKSLDSSVTTADGIDANPGRNVVDPGIDQIVASASQLTRAYGAAESLENPDAQV